MPSSLQLRLFHNVLCMCTALCSKRCRACHYFMGDKQLQANSSSSSCKSCRPPALSHTCWVCWDAAASTSCTMVLLSTLMDSTPSVMTPMCGLAATLLLRRAASSRPCSWCGASELRGAEDSASPCSIRCTRKSPWEWQQGNNCRHITGLKHV